MSLSLSGLSLKTHDGLFFRLELKQESFKLVLVVCALSPDFFCPVAQVMPLTLEELVRALKRLYLACKHCHLIL